MKFEYVGIFILEMKGIKSNLRANVTAIKARYRAKLLQVGYLPHLHFLSKGKGIT